MIHFFTMYTSTLRWQAADIYVDTCGFVTAWKRWSDILPSPYVILTECVYMRCMGFPLQVHQNLNRMGSNWSFRPWVGIRGACAYTWPSMEVLVVLEHPSC